jgi:hypothetical protein
MRPRSSCRRAHSTGPGKERSIDSKAAPVVVGRGGTATVKGMAITRTAAESV